MDNNAPMHDGIVLPAIVLNAAAIAAAVIYNEPVVALGFVSGLGWCLYYRGMRNRYIGCTARMLLHIAALERAHLPKRERTTNHLDDKGIELLQQMARLGQ